MQPPRATLGVRCAVVLALLALLVGGQAPASAHTELIASSPAAGATVPWTSDLVMLTFAADLLPVGNAIVVRDSDGHDVASGATQVGGSTLQISVAPSTPGRHTVTYRFVGLDGHAATGHLWFTVAADDAPNSAATALRADPPPAGPGGVVDVSRAAAGTGSLLALVCLIGGLGLLRRRSTVRRSDPAPHGEAARPWQGSGS